MALLSIALCSQLSFGQVTTQEVTDASETKATLMVTSSDVSGFQYKYGTLVEKDEIANYALAELSDPIAFTQGTYAWSARSAKGWVESNKNLSSGQSSAISTTFTLTRETEISFEWSVDSEENYGVLSFVVDGESVKSISGYIDFTTVTHTLPAGQHTLQWKYEKKSATNVGLDLGMVRNIDIQNTTPGEWIDKPTTTTSYQLTNLYPEQDYIFRAYLVADNDTTFSIIRQFTTDSVSVGNVTVSPITQATATLQGSVYPGDADVEKGFEIYGDTLGNINNSVYAKCLFTHPVSNNVTITKDSYWWTGPDYMYCIYANKYLTIEFPKTKTSSKINFTYDTDGYTAYVYYYYYNSYGSSTYGYKNLRSSSYSNCTLDIPANTYKLTFYLSSSYGNLYLKKISMPTLSPDEGENLPLTGGDDLSHVITGLKPNTQYAVRSYIKPAFSSELDTTWTGTYSDWVEFTTLPITADTLSVINKKQASVTIRGKVNGGDASIAAKGLQYRDATGQRWTTYPAELTASDELSTSIKRLKPATKYEYRSYIQATDCDTVFSITGNFTTEPVKALKPTLLDRTQYTAKIQGEVISGDATIYTRGMQFRKASDKVWTEIEDGGEDSTYVTEQTDLSIQTSYQARTYVQPAGCDTIFSEILYFNTLGLEVYIDSITDVYQRNAVIHGRFDFGLAENVEAELIIEKAEYIGNGEAAYRIYKKASIIPENGEFTMTIDSLIPNSSFYIRYNIWNDEINSYGGNSFITTKGYTQFHSASATNITQAKATLQVPIEETNDIVEERGFIYWHNTTDSIMVAGTVTDGILSANIADLKHNTYYEFCAYTKVDGKYYHDYKLDGYTVIPTRFKTSDIKLYCKMTDITQTKATMELSYDSGDATISEIKYYAFEGYSGEWKTYDKATKFTGLKPNTWYWILLRYVIDGVEYNGYTSNEGEHFKTKAVTVSASTSEVTQTSALVEWTPDYGDATFSSSGIRYSKSSDLSDALAITNNESSTRIPELDFNTTYYYQVYLSTIEGGMVFSEIYNFHTSQIALETLGVTNISNRSATLNGNIDCDSYSSAEFGFQWKPMTSLADPGFTKGYKTEDGSISVSLVNGMLTPDTDYQYRTAIRYKGQYYYTSDWTTFRTELEYILYPGTAYTLWRTDRENNCIVFCGYYVAGSEDVTTYGYEYWSSGSISPMSTNSGVTRVTTDANMEYRLDIASMKDGIYSVRAFVETASGTVYGQTLSFSISNGEVGSVDTVETNEIVCIGTQSGIMIKNATGLSVYIANLSGQLVATKHDMTHEECFDLQKDTIYLIRLSNGQTFKIKI